MDKKTLLQFLLLKPSRNDAPFFSPFANTEYPRIFQVTGANQNARKLLSTDLVNTKLKYLAQTVRHDRSYQPIKIIIADQVIIGRINDHL